MTDELDKRVADEQAIAALWRDQVEDGQQWKEETNEDAGDELSHPVTPPPAWKFIIPPRCQQLLAVGLSNKLRERKRKGEMKDVI